MKVGIVGVTGYTGEELLRVLSYHPEIELLYATSEQDEGKKLGEIFPWLSNYRELVISSLQQAVEKQADLVFFCLPPGQAAKWAERFTKSGSHLIDLGADFRFDDSGGYERWYDMSHPTPALLSESVYGLPELNREKIKEAQIVGNPGCYPTSILLAVTPFFRADMIAENQIFIDAKSGVSGAGKKPSKTTHFVEINENIYAYKPGRSHRHVGEIEQELSKIAGRTIQILFTPHLIPITRGLFSTIYLPLKSETNKEKLVNVISSFYQKEPFIRVLSQELPQVQMALHSNFCFIGVETTPDMDFAIVFSAIDNLGKGASWQAVQNMNLMLGIDETTGLIN